MMKVRIINSKSSHIIEGKTYEAVSVSMDPQKKYAVAEIFPNELFAAVYVSSVENDGLTGEYVDSWENLYDVPMLQKFSVDWAYIGQGFCKLRLWAPELVNEFGGSFEKTVKRFRFENREK